MITGLQAKRLVVLVGSLAALGALSACGMGTWFDEMQGESERPVSPFDFTEKRSPELNAKSQPAKSTTQAVTHVANKSAAKPALSAEQDPYDYYNEHGDKINPETGEVEDSDLIDKLLTTPSSVAAPAASSVAPKSITDNPVHKPFAGNIAASTDSTAAAPAQQSASSYAPHILGTLPAASVQPKPSDSTMQTQSVSEQSVASATTADDAQFDDNSDKPASAPAHVSPQPAGPSAGKKKDSFFGHISEFFERKDDPETKDMNYPPLSSVPPKSGEFVGIKDTSQQKSDDLKQSNDTAQQDKQSLDSEPTQADVQPHEIKPLLLMQPGVKIMPPPVTQAE